MNRHARLGGVALLFLASCGGGSTVALELTDAPPDRQNIDHVYISLAAVEVHVVDKASKEDGDPKDKSIDKSNKWQTITSRAGKFDLLALQNDVTASLGELDLPEGKITQIRLHIDEQGENTVVLKDGQQCEIDISKVDKTGIKINHPFKAIDLPPGERVRVVVDFDLEESIDQQGACSFALNPVIKIKKSEVTQ